MNGETRILGARTFKYISKREGGNREVSDVAKKTEEMYLIHLFLLLLPTFFLTPPS